MSSEKPTWNDMVQPMTYDEVVAELKRSTTRENDLRARLIRAAEKEEELRWIILGALSPSVPESSSANHPRRASEFERVPCGTMVEVRMRTRPAEFIAACGLTAGHSGNHSVTELDDTWIEQDVAPSLVTQATRLLKEPPQEGE